MAMSHSLIYRVCRGGDQCQTVRPGSGTARIKTRSRVSLQKSHTQIKQGANGVCALTLTHELEGAPKLALILGGTLQDQGAGGGHAWVLSDLKTLLETGQSFAG